MAEEQETDLTWQPDEGEFTSPLSAEQWAELLQDPAYVESDAGRGLLCLRDYGEPATFQQLSIQYRGTMGRFRRWLSDAAQMAGERFGVDAPQQDQYGLDEWWPLLYQTRPAGKPGANIYEMRLRPEVLAGFDLVNEKERQARKAEDVRNLKRIEQIERARQQERERLASEAARVSEESADAPEDAADAPVDAADQKVVLEADPEGAAVHETAAVSEPATESALRKLLVRAQGEKRLAPQPTLPFDVAAPVDYALRYAERLRSVFALMQEGEPQLSAAMLARALGDASVSTLQDILNGERIPDFAYVDNLRERMFVNDAYLEAREGEEGALPAFCSLAETMGVDAAAALVEEGACERVYVVRSASDAARSTVVVGLGSLRYALLVREEVPAQALGAVGFSECQVSASVLDALLVGKIWPGTVV